MTAIKFFFKKYLTSPFVRNVSKLTGATAIAQLISVGTAPVLYRIYDKEFYGTLGVYMAISSIIGTLSTFQYTQAIIIEKSDSDALQIIWLVRIINIAIAIISFFFIIFFGDLLIASLNNRLLHDYLIFLPISIFFSGQNELFRIWANRKERYSVMTLNGILTAIIVPAISIFIGLLSHSSLGLFIGLFSGQIFPSLFMWWQLSKSHSFGLGSLDLKDVKRMGLKYINFPKFGLPAEFINRFSNQLPILMLSHFAGAGFVGAYSLSVRILGLPIQLLSSSINEVFRQRASKDYNSSGNCKPIFIKTFKTLIILAIIPTLFISIYGPKIFVFFFGSNWVQAGVFSQLLAFLFFMKFCVSPLSFVSVLANKLHFGLVMDIVTFSMSFLMLYIGLKIYKDYNLGILLYSLGYGLLYLITFAMSYYFSKGPLIVHGKD